MVKFHAILAFGSNLAKDPSESCKIIDESITNLENAGITFAIVSSYYQSPAFPLGTGPDFVNAVALVETALSPEELLAVLHEIETAMGRERPYRWAPRVIDLDLIYYEDEVLPDPEIWREWANLHLREQMSAVPDRLILPHPRAHERRFVLEPLAKIAPDYLHPVYQKTPQQLLNGAIPMTLEKIDRKSKPSQAKHG